jgi:hypothetical protein
MYIRWLELLVLQVTRFIEEKIAKANATKT